MHMHEVHYAKSLAALPVAAMLFEIHPEKNTQVHARGIFYFKHSQTLTHCTERIEAVGTSAHTYLPLVPTVEIKLSYKHLNILLNLL